jgi:OOP family OmpA-OmpF porin
MKVCNMLFGVFMTLSVFGQDNAMEAKGKIVDAQTGKGIKAIIRYSSIPTGNIFGRFNDSTFSFNIFGSARYQITASAEGYNPHTVIIDPKELDHDNYVVRNILLTTRGETIVLKNLIFGQGKSIIDPASYKELDELAEMLRATPRISIQLEGHTDNTGNPRKNLALSQHRVDAVRRYLINKGVNKKRVQTKAFGGKKPLSNEMTEEARAANRRVELRIIKD